MNSAKLASERLTALGRVILAAGLLLTALLLPAFNLLGHTLLLFTFGVYLAYGLSVLVFLHRQAEMRWASRALVGDLIVLVVVLLAARAMPLGVLYFVLFLAVVAGVRRGWVTALLVSVVMSALFLLATLRMAVWQEAEVWRGYLSQERLAVLMGLVAGGGLVGYLAARERRYLEQRYETESMASLLRLDAPWHEVWRRWMAELCRRFPADRCLLAHRDEETDRVVVWHFSRAASGESYCEDERPPRDATTFLVDGNEVSFLAHTVSGSLATAALGRQGLSDRPAAPPVLPVRFQEEFQPKTLLSVAVPVSRGSPCRLWLLDGHTGAFTLEQFDGLQQLLNSLAPILANLLMVRRLLAQATNDERDRIARDLHDGVAQTVASLEMQLSVLLRQAGQDGGKFSAELERLRAVVREEKERLRAYVRTLKSVHVPPADLANWILAHCGQWQQETGIAVDVLVEPVGSALPEGVCREVFLILREALHNVRKHAQASHVLVKLREEEGCLRLLVDDDGGGFSFSGTYSQHALEELGLGPVSICERARALGATLTIDSTPGSGSTLRVDIPLS
ncbi:MAG: sensor histidine kinase [Acidobacteria bacterium]|nr:sensor histidine kinase [Acidobacteriota bacterium]